MDNQYTSYYLYKKYQVLGGELIDLGIASIDADGTMPTVIKNEYDPSCGYIPPTSPKYVLTLNDSTTVTGECDSISYIPKSDISAYTNSVVSVVIGDCVTTAINFDRCTGLTSVTLSSSVTNIGTWAFDRCSSLKSIDIPNSVTKIAHHAFSDCSSLPSITIPNSVTEIGIEAFYGCSSLTNVTLPSGITIINEYVFSSCTILTGITIPDSVTSIDRGAFYYCVRLSSVTIGTGVTSIGKEAFGGIYFARTIFTINAVIPPALGEDVFGDAEESWPRVIYVPSGSVNTYKTASGWSTFSSIIQAKP